MAIFAHNARAILGVFGLLLIAQLAARRPGGPGRAQRLILAGGELILAGVIAANVLVVGAGLGAYGERMARAMLPHGPVELAAYALALALYLQGRSRALPAASPGQGRGGERRAARARRRARDLRERMRPLRVAARPAADRRRHRRQPRCSSPRQMRSLHGSPLFQLSPSTTTAPPGRPRTQAVRRAASGAGHATPPGVGRRRRTPPPAGRPPTGLPPRRRHSGGGLGALLVAGLEIAAGLLLLGLLLVVLALRRRAATQPSRVRAV